MVRTDKVSSLLVVTEAEHCDGLVVWVYWVRVVVLIVGSEQSADLSGQVLVYMSSTPDEQRLIPGWLVLNSRQPQSTRGHTHHPPPRTA